MMFPEYTDNDTEALLRHPGVGNYPGRLARPPDPRNSAFPMEKALPAFQVWPMERLPKSKYWFQQFAPYDQGRESSCVGQTWHAILRGHPVQYRSLPVTPYQYYRACQRVDVWDGDEETPPRYEGSSTLAGAKVAHTLGYVSGYVWGDLSAYATTGEALLVTLNYLARVGTVAIGIDWRRAMWDTDAQGFIHATGQVDGGHEIKVLGYSRVRRAFRLVNSWGPDWGENGRCWLSFEDWEYLMQTGGDCAAPTETRVG
jgi:Papain family cysteine protease